MSSSCARALTGWSTNTPPSRPSPLQRVWAASSILGCFLFMPYNPRTQQPALVAALQTFAWTEQSLPSKLQVGENGRGAAQVARWQRGAGARLAAGFEALLSLGKGPEHALSTQAGRGGPLLRAAACPPALPVLTCSCPNSRVTRLPSRHRPFLPPLPPPPPIPPPTPSPLPGSQRRLLRPAGASAHVLLRDGRQNVPLELPGLHIQGGPQPRHGVRLLHHDS